MKAKIFKPAKTAMQSGRSKFNKWVLKFSDKNQLKDTMMGWNGGSSTISQIELKFSSKKKQLIMQKKMELITKFLKPEGKVINKSYADNFKWRP